MSEYVTTYKYDFYSLWDSVHVHVHPGYIRASNHELHNGTNTLIPYY